MAKLKWETIGLLFLSIIFILSLKNFIPVIEPFNSQTDEDDVYIEETEEEINIINISCPNGCTILPNDDPYSSASTSVSTSVSTSSSSDSGPAPMPLPIHPPTNPDLSALSAAIDYSNTYYDVGTGSQFTRQYPCEKSITGVFTECGPQGVDYTCF